MNEGKTGCALRLDLKNFFPRGQWERMTPEEKAAWKKKWEALKKRQKGGAAMNEPERDYLGNIICHCAGCDWCKDLEDSAGRTIYFCMNADSSAYLEETGLLGGCTFPPEYEMPEEG